MHGTSKYTLNGIFSIILNFNKPTIVMKPKNLLLLFISMIGGWVGGGVGVGGGGGVGGGWGVGEGGGSVS